MKLLRFGPAGQEKPGLLDDNGVIRDLSGHVGDITGDVLGDEALARIAAIDPASLPEVDPATRIGPCVGAIGKFLWLEMLGFAGAAIGITLCLETLIAASSPFIGGYVFETLHTYMPMVMALVALIVSTSELTVFSTSTFRTLKPCRPLSLKDGFPTVFSGLTH